MVSLTPEDLRDFLDRKKQLGKQVGIQKPLGSVHKEELWPDVLPLFCALQETKALRGKRTIWAEVSLA